MQATSAYLNRPIRSLAQVDPVLEAQTLEAAVRSLQDRIGKAQENSRDGETADSFASAYDACSDVIKWLMHAEQDALRFEQER